MIDMEALKKTIKQLEDAKDALLDLTPKDLSIRDWAELTVKLNGLIWDLKEKVMDQEGRCVPLEGGRHEL